MATHSAYDIYSDIITKKIYPQTRFKVHYIGYENTGHVGRLKLYNNGVPELHQGSSDLYIIFVNNMGNPSIFSLNDHRAIFSIDNYEDMSDDEYDTDWFEIDEEEVNGGKRKSKKGKTKKHRKKQMKKSRKKYKGGSGEAPSSSAMTPAQAKRDEEQRLFDDYLFQQTIQNQIKKNEKRIHDSSREELESLQNFREISKKIIDKLENQIILNEESIDEVKTKFNIVIKTPNLDLNYIQRIQRKIESNIEECKTHVETWKKEMKKTLHSIEDNRRKGNIMSSRKVSQREMDDHIFHKETLEKMIHYYQILISINTKAIEDFNKLLYEKLAPIKEEIVAKEFEDFNLEEKTTFKSPKKKGKKKK